VRVPRDTE